MTAALGPAQPTTVCPYPCLGRCGIHMPVPALCIACWLAEHTYEPRQVRMLPADDPRRLRVRDPRDRRRERPSYGRRR